MKILIVSDYAHISGGAAKVALESAIGLRSRGHEVAILAGIGPIARSLEEAGIEVKVLYESRPVPSADWMKKGIWNDQAENAMAELLNRGSDLPLVHIHSFKDSLSASILKPIFQRGAPCVMTAHDYGLACPYGGFFDYRRNTVCSRSGLSLECWMAPCSQGSYLKKLWFNVRQVAQQPYTAKLKHVVTISALGEGVLAPYLSTDCSKHRVDNPVVKEQLPRRERDDRAPFLFVGALVPHKGVLTAARAAIQANVGLNIVGTGPLETEIKALASFPGAKINLLGWLAEEDIQSEMASSRALVFPSVWYEGQPLVVLEAMSQGLPVICSDVSSASESVDRFGGSKYHGDDQDALAQLMVAHSGGELEHLSLSTYERFWQEPLTMDRHLDAIQRVYQSVLEGQG